MRVTLQEQKIVNTIVHQKIVKMTKHDDAKLSNKVDDT